MNSYKDVVEWFRYCQVKGESQESSSSDFENFSLKPAVLIESQEFQFIRMSMNNLEGLSTSLFPPKSIGKKNIFFLPFIVCTCCRSTDWNWEKKKARIEPWKCFWVTTPFGMFKERANIQLRCLCVYYLMLGCFHSVKRVKECWRVVWVVVKGNRVRCLLRSRQRLVQSI